MYLFYQDYSSEIHFQEQDSTKAWQNNRKVDTGGSVANSTALTALYFPTRDGQVIQTHLVYVDAGGVLQDLFMLGGNGKWTKGSLGDFKHRLTIGPGVLQRAEFVQGNLTDQVWEYLYTSGADGVIHEFSLRPRQI